MPLKKFSIAQKDPEMLELVGKTDQKKLAIWAIDCAGRVIHFFEEKFPDDKRPRQALMTLQNWIDTGQFHMAVIRKASLDSHAAARDVGEDLPARSAARACGQAVATAHVPRHAYGSAIYAQQAVFHFAGPGNADAAVKKERDWQYRHLTALDKTLIDTH
jgi:hypothetical protein